MLWIDGALPATFRTLPIMTSVFDGMVLGAAISCANIPRIFLFHN